MFPLHHEASPDPQLIQWIQDRIHSLLHVEPIYVAVTLLFLLCLIPFCIFLFYLSHKEAPPTNSDSR